jgi:hypothetical protein
MRPGRVVVFARPFVPGRVKTGLAPVLGLDGAAAVARALLLDTLDSLADLGFRPVVAWDDNSPPPRLHGVEAWSQGSGDLGMRIERTMGQALGGAPFAIALGGDTPGLPPKLLDAAVHRLDCDSCDAVLGPSHSGRLYLIGARRLPIGILRGLPWSTRDTYEATHQRLRVHGLRVSVLERWFDVDGPADLARLDDLLRRGLVRAKNTDSALRARRQDEAIRHHPYVLRS